jgi:glycosyltransferase involved in cell wall biosynthesis
LIQLDNNWPSDIHVLIPSYKSADLLNRFLPVLLNRVPAENICIVDDASHDGTPEVCGSFNIKYLVHDINCGKGAALSTGFKYLIDKGASWIITMDADGQHSPDDINCFLNEIRKNPGIGICIGARSMKAGTMPLDRICSNRLTSWIMSILSGARIIDSQCGYRIYSSELLSKIKIEYNRFEMESEVVLKSVSEGYSVCFTNVQTLYLDGKSHISHFKDTFRWVAAVLKIWMNLRKKTSQNSHGKRHEY